ncbi:hypothetical protein D3C86_882220 [compost metagenome]
MRVTRGQGFVDDQDFRFQAGDHRKAESRFHARRIGPDRQIDEFAQLGERDDLVNHGVNLLARPALDLTVYIDVLAARGVLAQAHAQGHHSRDLALHLNRPASGTGQLSQHVQKSRLASTVASDDAHPFAHADLKRNTVDGDLLALATACMTGFARDRRLRLDGGQVVMLAQILDTNRETHFILSIPRQ